MFKDSDDLLKLIKTFKATEQRVNNLLLKTSGTNLTNFRLNFETELNKVEFGLKGKIAKWGVKDLQASYKDGIELVDKVVPNKVETQLRTPSERVLNTYIELNNNSTIATNNVRNIVNNSIRKAEQSGVATISKVKDYIKSALLEENNNAMTISYKNGTKVSVGDYSQMLARTSRIETANTGLIDRAKEIGIDLVRCTTIGSTCPICAKYEGKIYSISGMSKDYPPLYNGENAPFKNGYNIMHPNCRHEFLPFIEEVYTNEELKDLKKQSNTFKNYTGEEKVFNQYNKNQAELLQMRKEEIAYNKMKQELGSQMPYANIDNFRNAVKNDSSILEKAKLKTTQKIKDRNNTL